MFVVNLPAPAALAETGNLRKTIEAVQYVDTCLGGVLEALRDKGGLAVVTSSHTGCERIASKSTPKVDAPNPVPFHLLDPENQSGGLMSGGSLADVAPTILGILGLDKPSEMTGRDLRIL